MTRNSNTSDVQEEGATNPSDGPQTEATTVTDDGVGSSPTQPTDQPPSISENTAENKNTEPADNQSITETSADRSENPSGNSEGGAENIASTESALSDPQPTPQTDLLITEGEGSQTAETQSNSLSAQTPATKETPVSTDSASSPVQSSTVETKAEEITADLAVQQEEQAPNQPEAAPTDASQEGAKDVTDAPAPPQQPTVAEGTEERGHEELREVEPTSNSQETTYAEISTQTNVAAGTAPDQRDQAPSPDHPGEKERRVDSASTTADPADTTQEQQHDPNKIKSNLLKWYRKPYLGGFRDKHTGVEYFHAVTQTTTPQEIRAMTKTGVYVSTERDRVLYPRPYITADEHEAMIIKQKEKRRKELAEKRRRKEIESRLHPKTAKDFEILYNGLESWRVEETEKINQAGYSEPARLTALAELLDQEASLIQKIDRLRSQANDENRDKAIVKLLEEMSSPKKWPVHGKHAGFCLVDTPNSIRARELRDLYHALNLPLLSVDERLQILLHVKYTVKEFDCNLTRDLVELIDREGDLLSRGREPSTLEGLRKRICNLFLQFIKTPEFNPEATLYQSFPDSGQAWKRDQAVYYCRCCTKYLPSTEFYLSTTIRHLGRCKACVLRENIANQRKDDTWYAEILKLTRAQEAAKRKAAMDADILSPPADFATSKVDLTVDPYYNAISLLQESDIRYLVDVIWNRQSAVSASKNMEELILTRWDPRQELSPWNCILLTKAEAANHDRQADPNDVYSDDFIRKIHQKHLVARQHFSRLPAMEKYLKRRYVENGEGRLVPRLAHDTNPGISIQQKPIYLQQQNLNANANVNTARGLA
ncbi:hypothetical protein HK102_001665, partial [Quaeritorhiza haematococci]